MFKGRWKIKELKVRWFCRNCLQKGIAGLTIHFASDVKPDQSEYIRIIQTTCHTNCRKPDIRIHYDSQSQLVN